MHIADEIEFRKIYGDFHPKILRYLTRLVGKHEAEDLTQEVFLKVSKALKDFRGESRLSTWIYKIATNTALDKLKSPDFKQSDRGRPVSRKNVADVEDKDSWTGEKAPLPDQQLIRKEMNECIRNIVDSLPQDYRTVIVLGELEELRNPEIADILGVSVDTVKIRLHRARARLKKELETHCSFYRNEQNEFSCDQKPLPIKFRKI